MTHTVNSYVAYWCAHCDITNTCYICRFFSAAKSSKDK